MEKGGERTWGGGKELKLRRGDSAYPLFIPWRRLCLFPLLSPPFPSFPLATSQLMTQSTRHKRACNKATSRNFLSAHRSGSTQKQCSKRTV